MSDAAAWRAYQIETARTVEQPSGRSSLRPAADMFGTAPLHALDLSVGPQIYFGRVIDCVPYARTYRVQLDRINIIAPCNDAVHGSLTVYGPRDVSSYAPGTSVIVLWHQSMMHGVILASMPDFGIDARLGLSDLISQGSNVGFKIDAANNFLLGLAYNGSVTDWSAGRPFDGLSSGERGIFTETGLALFLDSFQAYLRVDEATGLFLFYHDQLARLAGYNLQVRTAGHERDAKDDQGEYSDYEGWSPYAWEPLGRFAAAETGWREVDAVTAQNDTPYYSRYEPSMDDLQPYYRLQEFRGYLGQGFHRTLSVPPSASGPQRYANSTIIPGVWEEHLAMTGRYTMRNLRGFTLAKTARIVVPKQLRFAEDPTGDREANYKFSGVTGSGATPTITEDFVAGVTGINRAAAMLDQLAYVFNWEALHTFHYHALDWFIPEETALSQNSVAATSLPTFADLATGQFLDTMPTFSLGVDQRYGASLFHAGEASFSITDDGGIVLTDAYGFELRTSQGEAYLTVPGNMWLLPGKNLNAWAGYDVAIRAQNCADISAAQGDLRAKADGNVMILGGNNGCGGVVIESRATCPAYDFVGVGTAAVASGIMLLARQSPIVAMGNHMYLSTNRQRYAGEMHGDATAPDNDTGEFAGGSIVIDAGQHNVVTYAKTAHRHLGGSAIDIFVRDNTYVATEYNYDRAYIGMPLDVHGRLAVSDCVMAGGNVQTLGTYESSTGAAVSAITEDSGITTTMTQISARATTLGTYGDTANQEGRELVQGDADICLAEFSFRTVSQYGTSGLKLYELQWHQLARLSSQALPTWNEPSVTQLQKTGTDDETYPYPGRENWTGDGSTEAYVLQDLTLYTASTNTRDARGTPSVPNSYETATLPALQHVIMQDYYPVIVGF